MRKEKKTIVEKIDDHWVGTSIRDGIELILKRMINRLDSIDHFIVSWDGSDLIRVNINNEQVCIQLDSRVSRNEDKV